MAQPIRGKNGKFAGSIGDGRHQVPTPSPVSARPDDPSEPPPAASATAYRAFQERTLADLYARVAGPLGMSPDRVEEAVQVWAATADYEDIAAPDVHYRFDRLPGVPTDPNSARALRRLGYERYLATPYPVFVYGTLRRGQGNSFLLDGARENTHEGYLDGVAVYHGPGFPYAAEHDPTSRAVGEVVWLRDDAAGQDARDSLDYLEGFNSRYPSDSHYERVAREVTYTDTWGETTTVTAWVYLARFRRHALSEGDIIDGGDWVEAMRQRSDGSRGGLNRFS